VLTLPDPRTGALTPITPARPGVLRIRALLPDPASRPLAAIRVALTADLTARVTELAGPQALSAFAGTGDLAERAAFATSASQLGIHPPAVWTAWEKAAAWLGGPIDADIASHDAEPAATGGGNGARVTVDTAGLTTIPAGDPLAVRLALLTVPPGHPAALGPEAIRLCGELIASWRELVARWSAAPSRPMPAAARNTVVAAFDRLEISAALSALRALAGDQETPAGARFELFIHADRVLGLDLARDIGRSPG
jgi:hypothetical protein